MGEGILKDGIAAGRLAENQYVSNFADLHSVASPEPLLDLKPRRRD